MAKVYVITEPEMASLIKDIAMEQMIQNNMLVTAREKAKMTPEEHNRLDSVHRAFHMVCVRWAQSMGFTGVFR